MKKFRVWDAFCTLLRHIASLSVVRMLPLLCGASIGMNLLLELLGRRSPVSLWEYLCAHPLLFIYNSLIILLTMSLSLLFRRRIAVFSLISLLWLALGITNCIVLSYRSSPLSAIDLLIVKDAVGMFTVYLSLAGTILCGVGILGALALIVLLFRHAPKSARQSLKTVLCTLLSVGVMSALAVSVNAVGNFEHSSMELRSAYDTYGFSYCFVNSLLSHGVRQPDSYTDERMQELLDSLYEEDEPEGGTAQPNILFVQLESFFDPARVRGLRCTENPIPNFTALREAGSGGYLTVKSIGGGTANTEFEVLTGMELNHFGFGEYPYTTVLKNRACESLAQNLHELGYGTHALHNHNATFYNRSRVYANLGFDSFACAETMQHLTYNPLGWERDEVLTEEILSALDSTPGEDFVFAVTVQGHGRYPDEEESGEEPSYPDSADADALIGVSGPFEEALLCEFSYYVNQLRETDAFIGALKEALDARGEAYVLVLYGDHLPGIALEEDDLASGSLYQTDYVIYASDGVLSEGRDLAANELAAYVTGLLDMHAGEICRLRQRSLEGGAASDAEQLDEELKMLEYAQLYDESVPPAYEGRAMTFGSRPIRADRWVLDGTTLHVYGEGFTDCCAVRIDGFVHSAERISDTELLVSGVLFPFDELEVVVRTELGVVLE